MLFDHGKVVDLGTLGGASSMARGINVAYHRRQLDLRMPSHAFVYQGGHLVDLGTLAPTSGTFYGGTSYSVANAINDSGQIVGNSNGHAFLYDQGKMFDLNQLMPIPHITLDAKVDQQPGPDPGLRVG